MKKATNTALLENYLKHLRRMNRAQTTIYLYGRELSSFLTYVNKPLAHVTLPDCEAWLDRPRRKVRGDVVTPATIKREVMQLRSLLRWAYESELIPRNLAPKLRAPMVENEVPHPVPQEVWLDVWGQPHTDDVTVALGLGYFCGLRRSEITGLAATDFVGPKVWVTRKGHKKKQLFPWRSCVRLYVEKMPHLIGDEARFVEPLERLLITRGERPALLPWDDDKSRRHRTIPGERPEGVIDPNMMNRKLEPLGIRPHDLRHSFGTNLVRPQPFGAGVPVQIVTRLMGHSDPRVTMRYLDTGDDPLADLLVPEEEGAFVIPGRWA